VEFDPQGNFVRAWGGPGAGYEWPSSNHGITLDDKDNVWIGAHALVMKGVRIGRDSVVGAATGVRADVPPRVVVIGNPQQTVKKFNE